MYASHGHSLLLWLKAYLTLEMVNWHLMLNVAIR